MDDEEEFSLPRQRTARDLDFHEHDFISPACVHFAHDGCDDGCRFCGSPCTCPCHRWITERHRR